jgi:hypothetical protein
MAGTFGPILRRRRRISRAIDCLASKVGRPGASSLFGMSIRKPRLDQPSNGFGSRLGRLLLLVTPNVNLFDPASLPIATAKRTLRHFSVGPEGDTKHSRVLLPRRRKAYQSKGKIAPG